MKFKGDKDLPSLEFYEEMGILKLSGRSTSVGAIENFWKPLLEKLEKYLETPRNMFLSINLEYFSTASAKAILDMFKLISKKLDNKKFIIEWYWDDEDILEAGEDYQTMIPEAEFKFIDKNEDS